LLKKVAYLVSEYPAISHTFILREICHLRKMNFDIFVASINKSNLLRKPSQEEISENLRTYYVKKERLMKIFFTLLKTVISFPLASLRGLFFAICLGGSDLKRLLLHLFYFIEAVMVGNWMKTLNVSHLHVHFANPSASVGLILTKTFPFTFSMTVHGPDVFDDITLNNLKKKIEGASFICCIGNYAQSQLMKLSDRSHWHKLEIAPLGVDTSLFRPESFRQYSSTFNILCVGRLVPAKGQQVLVTALGILVKQGYRIELCLVGDGPDMKKLKKEVVRCGLDSQIVFRGSLNQDEVLKAYKKADFFALASFSEGIPVALMEAMSMEIPCIATHIAGIPELIRHGIDGLLVPPVNAEEIASSIANLINNPDLRKKLGKAGRKRVLEKYEQDRNVEHLGNIFTRRLQGLKGKLKNEEI